MKLLNPPNIVNYSLSEQVYSILLQQIMEGKIPFNEKINEAEVVQALGVSRTPVREAFKMLERDGLLVHRPNIGVFVKPLTERSLTELYQVRAALETLALRLAYGDGTNSSLTREMIGRLLEDLENLENVDEMEKSEFWSAADVDFHRKIVDLSNNHYLQRVLGNLFVLINTVRLRVAQNPTDLEQAIRQHKAILLALKENDLEKAVRNLDDHICWTVNKIKTELVFEEESDPDTDVCV